MTARLCDICSVLSETEKTFCPECGTPYDQSLRQPDWRRAGHSRGLPLAVKLLVWLPLVVMLLAEVIFQVWGGAQFPYILGAEWDWWSAWGDSFGLVWYAFDSFVPLAVFAGIGLVISLGSSNRVLCFVPLIIVLVRLVFAALSGDLSISWDLGVDVIRVWDMGAFWFWVLTKGLGVLASTVALAVVGAVTRGGSR